jgi:hypothetical protein
VPHSAISPLSRLGTPGRSWQCTVTMLFQGPRSQHIEAACWSPPHYTCAKAQMQTEHQELGPITTNKPSRYKLTVKRKAISYHHSPKRDPRFQQPQGCKSVVRCNAACNPHPRAALLVPSLSLSWTSFDKLQPYCSLQNSRPACAVMWCSVPQPDQVQQQGTVAPHSAVTPAPMSLYRPRSEI